MSSDRVRLRAWLKALNDERFVALPPATRENGPFDAADVRVAAAEVIAARGLAVETPFIGWHSQSDAFDRAGRLVGAQYIYHGGDLAEVRRRLATVPPEFEIDGGTNAEEAFLLRARFDANMFDPDEAVAVEAGLAGLEVGSHWIEGQSRARLLRLPDQAALAWLHRVLAGSTEDQLRARAWILLDAAEDLTADELGLEVAQLNPGRFAKSWVAVTPAVGVGPGWRPPSVASHYDLWPTLDEVRDLSDEQETWFRATLLDPPTEAVAELDAYLLEPLVACGRFTTADADRVLRGWRRRFVRKPEPYSRVQPALLSLVIGLFETDHPRAEEVWAAVMALPQKWARPIQAVLSLYADDDVRPDLRDAILTTHLDERFGAVVGYLFLTAEHEDASPAEAAVSYVSGGAPAAQVAVRLALELVAGHPRLLSPRFVHPEVRAAGEELLGEAALPEAFLAAVQEFLDGQAPVSAI